MIKVACLLFLYLPLTAMAQWDPDAGLVPPHTRNATIQAAGQHPEATTDGDLNTKWESEALLPAGYISSERNNIFLKRARFSFYPAKAKAAFDGDTETSSRLNNKALRILFNEATPLKRLSVKASSKEGILIALFSDGKIAQKHQIAPESAYHLIQIPLQVAAVDSITISSPSPFLLFEIAGLQKHPATSIVFDLKREHSTGWIETRHYAGEHVTAVDLFIAGTSGNFQHLTSLQPEALNTVTTRFRERKVRYIKLRYQLNMVDYAKAFLWEVKAYDRHGPYGPAPLFKPRNKALKNTMGINTFWGWGRDSHAGELPAHQGPGQFSGFMRHVRYYHNLDWDIAKPGDTPDYTKMPGSLNQPWLDWDREYLPVWKQGFSIQATLQIPHNFPPEEWGDSTYQAAYRYGKAFADYFSNHHQNLVEAVEIGNEPWQWGPDFYRSYFEGMAQAIKTTAPQIKVLPCALSADKQQPGLNNYAGEWLRASDRRLLDGINTHLYSYTNNAAGERVAVHPEHPASEMRGILNVLRFRNQNLPDKEVHVTEWGWDSSSESTGCTHPVCVSEEAQAAYALRGMLWLYRMGVDKMHWFFFSDEDKASHRFTRSGLLSAPEKGLQPKASYHVLKKTMASLGNAIIYDVEENEDYYVYYFRQENKQPSHAVVWIPQQHEATLFQELKIALPGKPVKAFLPGQENSAVTVTQHTNNYYSLKVGTYPVIITF
jgi:hypothetical protein